MKVLKIDSIMQIAVKIEFYRDQGSLDFSSTEVHCDDIICFLEVRWLSPDQMLKRF